MYAGRVLTPAAGGHGSSFELEQPGIPDTIISRELSVPAGTAIQVKDADNIAGPAEIFTKKSSWQNGSRIRRSCHRMLLGGCADPSTHQYHVVALQMLGNAKREVPDFGSYLMLVTNSVCDWLYLQFTCGEFHAINNSCLYQRKYSKFRTPL